MESGLINTEQAGRILALYPPGADERTAGRRWLVALTATIGAVLVGAGMVMFVAANWQAIPGTAKLLALVVGMLVSYAAGYHLRFTPDRAPLVGTALLLLGALLYGAALFLLAQGLHLPVVLPALFAAWAVGLLPLAYLLRLPGVLHVALFAVLAGIGSWVWGAGAVAERYLLSMIVVLGALLYTLGEAHQRRAGWRGLGAAFSVWGVPLLLLGVYGLSFQASASGLNSAFLDGPGSASIFLVRNALLAGAIIVAGTAVVLARHGAPGRPWDGLMVAAVMLLVAAGDLLAPPQAPRFAFLTVLATPLLLTLSLGLAWLGRERGRPGWINLGLFFAGLLIITRYLALFGGLLPTSVVFITAGALLIALAWGLERTRRHLNRGVRHA